jgi:methanol--5-hydroxybenzimidazolylcobamide Co-methyltransferase
MEVSDMNKKYFTEVAYKNLNDFVYGKSIYPVTAKNGLTIGNGIIIPEINYTLHPMTIESNTMPEVLKTYREMTEGVLKRAVELFQKYLVIEIETLPPMTFNPRWGEEVIKTVKDVMNEYEAKHDIKVTLRLTPVDSREGNNVEHMWYGKQWEQLMEVFTLGAKAGADYLAIESVGGKDVHDEAVMFGDIKKSIFALGVLGVRDMKNLWKGIVNIADETGTIASGDTACGFGNTAMVLADRNYVSKTFASVVRLATVVRSLVAIEEGAVGPHKDCGYEGVYIKAITGTPISLEGKSSACAHFSPVGNIAAAVADLWSNESVQNLKLLSGPAPIVSLEQLVYDTRLMNKATETGNEVLMRDLLVESDSKLDPQAYVLRPDVALRISKEMLKEETHLERTIASARLAIEELRSAYNEGKVNIDDRDYEWLGIMENQIDSIPEDEDEFIAEMIDENTNEKFSPEKYDLVKLRV